VDPVVAAFGAHALAAAGPVTTPDARTADALQAAGLPATATPLAEAAPGSADALALLADELGRAGEHAEELVHAAAGALRPGGTLAVAALSAMHARANGGEAAGRRAYTAAALGRMLGMAGLAVAGLWAPGAASRLAGQPAAFDPEGDRQPGLLDAGPLVAAVARRYRDRAEREDAYYASLPRKVVAAAVVCRDADERMLVVYDAFKQEWTVPGGVVDADEDPRTGAVREAREEAGVDVEPGDLLGVFAMRWPDRLLLVYAARPVGDPTPRPLHGHEIAAAEWVPLEAAVARLAPRIGDQVRRCLEAPGRTWDDG
jgi:ADP-ribose pyrophosphatase YjhB (NUDIX family)